MHETHARTDRATAPIDQRLATAPIDQRLATAPIDQRLAGAPIDQRLAGAPISWGACEIPGWGVMASPDVGLAGVAELGRRGPEFGSVGFFPDDATSISAQLERY